MVQALDTPQQIGPTFDEETLRRLSLAQNGAAGIGREEDGTGKTTGFLSRYPIDLTKYVAPAIPAAQRALLDYASARQNAILSGVWSFDVAAQGQPARTVTTRLDGAGQFAMIKIDVWAQTNAAAANASLPYSNVDYSATALNPAEASSLAAQAGAIDARSYAILNQVAAGIGASPPAITATDQIDEAFAALDPTA